MANGRQYFTSTVVGSSVLIAGGMNGAAVLAGTELYQGSAFVAAPGMASCQVQSQSCTARAAHTATLLKTGSVLIAGGLGSAGASIALAELFGGQ
jgi:hypothetical protein